MNEEKEGRLQAEFVGELKEARAEYERLYKKKLTNKKNDLEWIKKEIENYEDLKNSVKTQEAIATEVVMFELKQNIKCGGVRYEAGHKYNEFDANFNTFKQFS